MPRPKSLSRPRLFRRAATLQQADVRLVARRKGGTELYELQRPSGYAFTREEIVRARFRDLEASHIHGLGKKKLKRELGYS